VAFLRLEPREDRALGNGKPGFLRALCLVRRVAWPDEYGDILRPGLRPGGSLTLVVQTKESRILGIIESSTGEYAVISLACWVVWLMPFFITRQHVWVQLGRGFAAFVGTIVIGWLCIKIVKGGFLSACGRLAKRLWNTCVAMPAKFVYTILIGHPRYWYKVEDHLEYTESSSKMNKAAFQPAYVYLPLGGIFRKCRMVWPGNHWRIERERLGLRGYRIVDREGGAVALRVSRAWLSLARTCLGPGYEAYSRPVLIVGHDNRELDIEAKTADKRILHIFDREIVTYVLEGLRRESVSPKDTISRLESSISFAETERVVQLAKRDAEEAMYRLELAKRLAGVAALVKAAPRNKKLGAARHQLTQIVVGLADSEEKAKALLLDALEALEQSESQSN